MGCFGSKHVQVVLVGPPGSGKTMMQRRLKGGDPSPKELVTGMKFEHSVSMHLNHRGSRKAVSVVSWKGNGVSAKRVEQVCTDLFYPGADALLFMIDADQPDTFESAAVKLREAILDPRLKYAMFGVLINKMDLPNNSYDDVMTEMWIRPDPRDPTRLTIAGLLPTQTLQVFRTSGKAEDWYYDTSYGFEAVSAYLLTDWHGLLDDESRPFVRQAVTRRPRWSGDSSALAGEVRNMLHTYKKIDKQGQSPPASPDRKQIYKEPAKLIKPHDARKSVASMLNERERLAGKLSGSEEAGQRLRFGDRNVAYAIFDDETMRISDPVEFARRQNANKLSRPGEYVQLDKPTVYADDYTIAALNQAHRTGEWHKVGKAGSL